MTDTRLVLTLAGAACAAALVLPAALTSGAARSDQAESAPRRMAATEDRAARLPRIRGYVGADFTITVNKRRVPKGRYRLVVKDEGTTHNWHIEGRRVDKRTSIDGVGKWVWKVRLRKGTYTIVCDAHPAQMSTSLRVTAG